MVGSLAPAPKTTVDIFDPATEMFTATTPLNFHRSNHNAVLLGNGLVWVIGGTTLESGFLAQNEAYDPDTQIWHLLDPGMNENRSGSTANMLVDGTIFVAGGVTGNFTLSSAEILDPATLAFSPISPLNVGQEPAHRHLVAGWTSDSDWRKYGFGFSQFVRVIRSRDEHLHAGRQYAACAKESHRDSSSG